MMKSFVLCFLFATVFFTPNASAQHTNPDNVQPDTVYENIYVKKIYSDSLSSSFIIWVKKDVPAHKHNFHTEVVTVISGSATMHLGKEEFDIKRGDIIVIPMTVVHSVTTTSSEPLKVLSVQSPEFNGSDREMVY